MPCELSQELSQPALCHLGKYTLIRIVCMKHVDEKSENMVVCVWWAYIVSKEVTSYDSYLSSRLLCLNCNPFSTMFGFPNIYISAMWIYLVVSV